MKRILGLDTQVWLGLALVIGLAVNVGLAFSISNTGEQAEAKSFEDLEVIMLSTPECEHCFDLSELRAYFVQNGVKDEQIRTVAYDSREGKRLIKKHEIKRVPTAVIPEADGDLDFMAGLIENIGSITNGAFVVRDVQLPYLDLESDAVVGQFELILLDDESCVECYDVQLHTDVLKRLFMTPSKTTTVDVSSQEGKDMLESYAIMAVPTIVLRGDLAPYTALQEIWPGVGTMEDDGSYILRQGVSNMGAYRQLPGGEIIDTTTASDESAT